MKNELEWLKSLKLRSDISLGEDGYKYLDNIILALTNLRPLEEKEVMELVNDIASEFLGKGSGCNITSEGIHLLSEDITRHICSHFSKPQNELVKALEDYIVLLGKELDEVVPMASVHGWKSSRFEEGKKMRKKIKALNKDLTKEK